MPDNNRRNFNGGHMEHGEVPYTVLMGMVVRSAYDDSVPAGREASKPPVKNASEDDLAAARAATEQDLNVA